MTTPPFFLEAPQRLRALVRAREAYLVALAALIGVIGGLSVAAMGAAVSFLHALFFAIPFGERLSSQLVLNPWRALLVPALGGLLLGLSFLLVQRWRPGREVDPIEANALHGGRMSFRGSLIVSLQTVWSSGVGASVGLEAGYTQLASGLASSVGRGFRLRRSDQRLMVGCGAAAAIAGAFGAPLAGAFYAFELVIGAYTPASLAAVGMASLIGYSTAHALLPLTPVIDAGEYGSVGWQDMTMAAVLGVLAALYGIGVMRSVATCESVFARIRAWPPLRLLVGGLIVGLLALVTPHVMASGHGAIHLAGVSDMTITAIATLFVLKTIASIASIGSGFRGGLFFASLLIGALGGHLFGSAAQALWPSGNLDPTVFSIIGMGALSASIIGGPMTMAFLALETTGDLWVMTAVLIAIIISTQLTREVFGYSFSTWRFHLRGETIRSAADVGWIRDLTVARMMRPDVSTAAADQTVADFRARFPLGSKTQVVAVDAEGRYIGIVFVADTHAAESDPDARLRDMIRYRDITLLPAMNIQDAVAAFDRAEAESLAVVDAPDSRRVVGILTEAHALRRYAEESEKHRREAIGDV